MFLFLLTHVVTHTFSFWPSRDPAPSIPLSNPASRFRWALLEFPVEFCYFEFEHVLLFVSIIGFSCLPTPPSLSLQFSSLFSLVFGFYQSVAHGPFRRRNPNPGGNLPVFASVGTTVLPPREKGHKHHHLHDQNPFSRAVRMYMCACVCVFGKRWDNRGGTVEVF